MVCLGNICRSPMAQGLMEHKIKLYGLPWQVDSAGTSSFHAGERPDERAIACMKKYGIDISNQSARPFQIKDFESFNLIYCMDKSNYRHVLNLAKNENHKKK
ncbi:MAG: low molecular weight protein-tyrosine-phosphatase [Chitinophagales bacterium]|nr:low molecular weight protein-tyrosine-phosphatase [Chitinophagales bacterium]